MFEWPNDTLGSDEAQQLELRLCADCAPSTAHERQYKLRVCANAKSSGTNDAYAAPEAVTMVMKIYILL
jgi:hypothetical protein